jgi:hypothetical protein
VPIDFAALVLGPCEDVLAIPITVTPTRSIPDAAPYCARGIWTSRTVEVPMDDGTIIRSNDMNVGINIVEFPALPMKGDGLLVGSVNYTIYDVQIDGQGGAKLVVRNA